tara:strand:- start:15116 stop:16069 length:954 start_codon:yes stop_codon:yes gene_type:complete
MKDQDIKNSESHIDILQIIEILWKKKLLIISVTSFFAIFSIFFALSLPNKYQSSSLVKVTEVNNQSSGGAFSSLTAQYGGLASMAGVSLPSSGLDSGTYISKIIKSRQFAKHLMSFETIKPKLMAISSYDISLDKIIYDHEIYDDSRSLWVREPTGIFQSEPTYLEVHETALKALEVNINEKTGLITISFEHLSPVFAQEFVSIVIREVNNVTREIKLKESKASLDYLENALEAENNRDLKLNINNLILQQLNKNMIASVKDDYLISQIDPPIVPVYKSSPNRARICILITLIGIVLSIVLALISNNFNIKNKSLYE